MDNYFELIERAEKDCAQAFSRLDEIASQTFTRYFDRSVGLSPQELVNTNTKNFTNIL